MTGVMLFLLFLLFVLMVVMLVIVARMSGSLQDLSRRHAYLADEIRRKAFKDDEALELPDVDVSPPVTEDLAAPEAVDVCVPAVERPVPASPPPLPVVQAAASGPPALAASGVAASSEEELDVGAPGPAEAAPRPAVTRQGGIAESAGGILRKIWCWIMVGEEHRIEGMTVEYAVASTWLLRLGVLAIALGAAYFLQLSLYRIPDVVRVLLGAAGGIALLGFGARLLRGKYRPIGQGLMGCGILVLYLCAYVAGPILDVVDVWVAFVLMILVTIGAGFVSVKGNSLLAAIVGLAGGYLTPIVLSTGTGNLPVLYSYILLLSLGILGVARLRQWRLLNYLGFVLTYFVFFGSLWSSYDASQFWLAMWFLTALFIIHSALVYVHNIARGHASTSLEILHLVGNAVAYSCTGWGLIQQAHGRPFPALLMYGLALFYAAHALVFLRRKLADRALMTALVSLAAAFALLTLPLALEKETLTVAFSLLAVLLLWLGRRLDSGALRLFGRGGLGVVMFRLLFMDFFRSFDGGAREIPLAEYWGVMAERLWAFGVPIAALIGAYRLETTAIRPDTDVVPLEDSHALARRGSKIMRWFLYGVIVFVTFLYAQLELGAMFRHWPTLQLPVLTLVWCATAAYFLWRFMRGGACDALSFTLLCVALAGGSLKLLFVDVSDWTLGSDWVYHGRYLLKDVAARAFDFTVVVGMYWWVARQLSRERKMKHAAPLFGYSALVIFTLYSTWEANTWLREYLPEFQEGGLSVVWTLLAVAFTAVGISTDRRLLRYGGLGLFCIVIGKVFLIDLQNMEILYRVIAFLVLGCALLAGSFAYVNAQSRFRRSVGEESGREDSREKAQEAQKAPHSGGEEGERSNIQHPTPNSQWPSGEEGTETESVERQREQ